MFKTFKDYLIEKSGCHTKKSLDGFERWLENLDQDLLMSYAERFAEHRHQQGVLEGMDWAITKFKE